MFEENDFKTNDIIVLENEYTCSSGCTEIHILQNWRNILTIKKYNTSGSRASDIWSEPETYNITAKEFAEMLNEEIIDPWGRTISHQRPMSNYSWYHNPRL